MLTFLLFTYTIYHKLKTGNNNNNNNNNNNKNNNNNICLLIDVPVPSDRKLIQKETENKLKYKVKVKLSLCLTKHYATKTCWGSGGIAPRILELETIWRLVVSFTPQLLYPQGKSPWYPLDRRLGGPQSRSERGGEEIRI
jgi:hypothetical protein